MLNFKPKSKSPLDEAIDKVLLAMDMYGPEAEEYPDLLSKLERLTKVKAANSPAPVSRDALVNGLSGVLQVLVIVAYEQHHVMTSKGLGFVMKQK